jgi:hypothetical protein
MKWLTVKHGSKKIKCQGILVGTQGFHGLFIDIWTLHFADEIAFSSKDIL